MYSVDSIKRTVHLAFHGLFFSWNTVFLIEIFWNNYWTTVENSMLNRDSTFNRTVRLIESTEYTMSS